MIEFWLIAKIFEDLMSPERQLQDYVACGLLSPQAGDRILLRICRNRLRILKGLD